MNDMERYAGLVASEEYGAIVAAIKANRDDDLPRHVAADWWDDHGVPERAEYVRLQIDRDGLKCTRVMNPCTDPMKPILMCPNCQRAKKLITQSEQLLKEFGEAWVVEELLRPAGILESSPYRVVKGNTLSHPSPGDPTYAGTAWDWTWHRGFIDTVSASARDVFAHAEGLLAQSPVRNVRLTSPATVTEVQSNSSHVRTFGVMDGIRNFDNIPKNRFVTFGPFTIPPNQVFGSAQLTTVVETVLRNLLGDPNVNVTMPRPADLVTNPTTTTAPDLTRDWPTVREGDAVVPDGNGRWRPAGPLEAATHRVAGLGRDGRVLVTRIDANYGITNHPRNR